MVAPYPEMRRDRGMLLCGAEGNKGDERGLCEQGGVLQTLCVVAAIRGLRSPPATLPPAIAQRALQARRGDGFQPEVSGGFGGAVVGSEHSGSGAVSAGGVVEEGYECADGDDKLDGTVLGADIEVIMMQPWRLGRCGGRMTKLDKLSPNKSYEVAKRMARRARAIALIAW